MLVYSVTHFIGNATLPQTLIGSGRIWLNNVQCTGTEKSLMNCTASLINSCSHTQDAGVFCFPGRLQQFALQLSYSSSDGR